MTDSQHLQAYMHAALLTILAEGMPMCGSVDQMGLGISPRFVVAQLAAVWSLVLGARSALRQNEVLACGE